MKVYLLRHGETEWNKKGFFQGQVDVALNDYGREIAELTRRGLADVHWDKVYSSPLCRALETACIVSQWPQEHIVQDERLKEISFGRHEGSPIKEVMSNELHPLYDFMVRPDEYVPTGGAESIDEAMQRTVRFFKDCIFPLESSCDNVLVTIHGALMRAIVASYGYKQVKDYWKVSYPNCAVTILDVCQGRVDLLEEAKVFYDLDPNRFLVTPINKMK